jgi:hypothetical protein
MSVRETCVATALAAASICGAVNADFIVVNNPVVDTVGFYSDAFDSNGAYTYAQSGAQAFSLEDSYTASSLRWWGSMNGFNDQGISNIDCFQIIVWDSNFESQVFNQKIDLANIKWGETGDFNFFGQPVYEFVVPLAFQITTGNYFMNIGAQLNDAAGDQFVWSQGENVDGFWFTDNNGQYDWGDWRPLPNFIGNTAGGAFVLSAPSPGAIALLGMAGMIGRRRR